MWQTTHTHEKMLFKMQVAWWRRLFYFALSHHISLFSAVFFSLLILISWFSFEICVCHTLLCETRSVGDRAKFSILIRLTYTFKQIYTHFYRIDADVRKKNVTQWNVRQSIQNERKKKWKHGIKQCVQIAHIMVI